MKKVAYYSMVIILGIGVVFTLMYEFGIPRVNSVTAVESFGNQVNRQLWTNHNYALDGDWLYGLEGVNHLAKRQLNNDSEPETIFSTTGDWMPCDVSVYDGWIYFSIQDYREGGDIDLYRLREDGGSKRKLLNGGDDSNNYVLTKEGIVYLKYGSIYIMNLDGNNKRKISNEDDASSIAINNNWIYFYASQDLYRMKPDGSKLENITSKYPFDLIDQNIRYLVKDVKKQGKSYLYKITSNGEKTLLATASFDGFNCLNIEGDWLYYGENNKVYKIKKTAGETKQLVYQGKKSEKIFSLLVKDGNVLVVKTLKNVYIKKDGEVIEID